jgi:hypothetical protein
MVDVRLIFLLACIFEGKLRRIFRVSCDAWPEFSSRTKMDDRNSSVSRRHLSRDDAMPFRWYGYIFHEIYFMLMDLVRRADTA